MNPENHCCLCKAGVAPADSVKHILTTCEQLEHLFQGQILIFKIRDGVKQQ